MSYAKRKKKAKYQKQKRKLLEKRKFKEAHSGKSKVVKHEDEGSMVDYSIHANGVWTSRTKGSDKLTLHYSPLLDPDK